MRRALTITASLVALSAGSALAEEGCFVPMADWKQREAVASMAKDLGWTVRRIKIDDGCYEIVGTDAEGRKIEAKVNPATLEILEIEPRGHEGSHEKERRDD